MILTSDFIQKNPNLTQAYVGVMKLFGQPVNVKSWRSDIHEQIQYAAFFAAQYDVKTNTDFNNSVIKINPDGLKASGFTASVIHATFGQNMYDLAKKDDFSFGNVVGMVAKEKEMRHGMGIGTKEWSGMQIAPKNKR